MGPCGDCQTDESEENSLLNYQLLPMNDFIGLEKRTLGAVRDSVCTRGTPCWHTCMTYRERFLFMGICMGAMGHAFVF